MKKGKLSLDQLKVDSFVTGMEKAKSQTAKGGVGHGSEPHTVCCFEDNTNTCTWGNAGCDIEWTRLLLQCDA